MRRVLTTAVMVGVVMLLGSVTLPQRSVMAGVQQRLTPVVHAQQGSEQPGIPNCLDLGNEFYDNGEDAYGFYSLYMQFLGYVPYPFAGWGYNYYDMQIWDDYTYGVPVQVGDLGVCYYWVD